MKTRRMQFSGSIRKSQDATYATLSYENSAEQREYIIDSRTEEVLSRLGNGTYQFIIVSQRGGVETADIVIRF